MNRLKLSEAISHLIPEILRGAQTDFFTESPMTQTQLMMLLGIHTKGSCCMSEIAQQMKVTMPTATGIIQRLVKAGYVIRQNAEQDRRHVHIKVTAKGVKYISDFKKVIQNRWEKVLSGLDNKEMDQFYGIVLKLQQYLKTGN